MKITEYETKMAMEIFSTDAFLVVNKKLLSKIGFEKAIYICNLVDKMKYFQNKGLLEDGSFFLTHAQQTEQTGLSEYQQRENKKYFLSLGIIKTYRKGIPAKEFYQIDLQKLVGLVFDADYGCTEKEGENSLKPQDDQSSKICRTKGGKNDRTKHQNTKGLYKETKYKETKDNIYIPEKKKTIRERNKDFLPLAEYLANIVHTNKNIHISPIKLNSWSDDFRKLNEIEKIDYSRMERALNWYAENIGKKYVPIIESGVSFRNKFLNLEAAIERDPFEPTGQSKPPATETEPFFPEQVLKKYLRYDSLAGAFLQQVYEPALDLFEENDHKILAALISLHKNIQKIQEDHMTEKLTRILPSPITLLANYIDWLEDNDWITDKHLNLLDMQSPIFRRFIRAEAEKDNLIRNPLTGKSYLQG